MSIKHKNTQFWCILCFDTHTHTHTQTLTQHRYTRQMPYSVGMSTIKCPPSSPSSSSSSSFHLSTLKWCYHSFNVVDVWAITWWFNWTIVACFPSGALICASVCERGVQWSFRTLLSPPLNLKFDRGQHSLTHSFIHSLRHTNTRCLCNGTNRQSIRVTWHHHLSNYETNLQIYCKYTIYRYDWHTTIFTNYESHISYLSKLNLYVKPALTYYHLFNSFPFD